MLQVVGQDSNITARMWGLPADDVVELSTEPYHYRCEKDRLRQSLDDVFAAEMTRCPETRNGPPRRPRWAASSRLGSGVRA